jgi:AraC-like DNA-binding protein
MKPHLLKVPGGADHSFSFRQFKQPNVNNRWHYHPELELIRIHQGHGTQFMGDHIKRFQADDIVLVGSNLPHFWRYDDEFAGDERQESVCSTVIHFTENLWGERFWQLPENKLLKRLIDQSQRGLLLMGETRHQVAGLMEKIRLSEGSFRLIYLLECLAVMATCPLADVVQLSSSGFQHQSSETEHERINSIYEYSFKHFRDRIPLEIIAFEVGLTPNSFCRYFKSKTGKSFTAFILELRVGYACKLLLENKLNNKQICYESGFNNFTSFHKHFKAITGMSPQHYQKAFIHKTFTNARTHSPS